MKNKKMLIGWFIGVGCGMFLSGIALSIILYTSNKAGPMRKENQTQIGPQETTQDGENLVTQNSKANQEPVEVNEKTKETSQEDNIKKEAETTPPPGQTIEINIKPTATAHDITRILVDQGVISDYDGFIALIVSKDAERKLSHGTKVFPLNSDIETVFKLLRP